MVRHRAHDSRPKMSFAHSFLWIALAAITALLQLGSPALAAPGPDLYSKTPLAASILASSGSSPLPSSSSQNPASNHTRQHPDLHVLGYVTPWNAEGFSLVESYRGRFTSVSPVWYSVRINHAASPESGSGEAPQYAVHGGPSTPEEVGWYRRLRKWDLDDATGLELPPVKVLPRFVLEGWTTQDYQDIIGSATHGISLTEAIFAEVSLRGYDGIVLEAAAAWAMREPIKLLADRLHADGKELVVVLQALREGEGLQESNKAVMLAVEELTPIVDWIHVMVSGAATQAVGRSDVHADIVSFPCPRAQTYDFLGPPGAPFDPASQGSHPAAASIPPESPLLRPGVRSPGPNAPFSYLEANVESLTGHLELSGRDPSQQVFSPFGSGSGGQASQAPGAKLLAGLPMYGYSYPLAHLDIQGTPHVALPPLLEVEDDVLLETSDEAQAEVTRARRKAEEEARTATLGRGLFPVLSGPGEPVTIRDVRELLHSEPATLVRVDEGSDEMVLDYFKAKGGSEDEPGAQGTVTAWYRRAYVPSYATMQARLNLVEENGAGGVAVWDVGQGGAWLLHAL